MTQKTINDTVYQLTFEDNFNTLSAFEGHKSGGVWATSFSPHMDDTRYLASNGEGQYYADPSDTSLPNPFSVNNGVLSIHAHELTAAQSAQADGQSYVSGLLTTELSFGAQNGYIEISANVPDQQGFLASFWLLPTDGDCSSEIDVFETLGSDPTQLNTNVWNNGTDNQLSIPSVDLSNGFHTYGLEWTQDSITWYLDGAAVRTVDNTVHESMYLVTSLAVDTNWTGSVDDTTDFSDPFQIDYIRVYETPDVGNNDSIEDGQYLANPIPYGEGVGSETLFGTNFDDEFAGGGGADTLYGRDGDDQISGGDGADMVFGQDGDDLISGDAGGDKLIGGAGSDVLIGGTGTDHIWGGVWSADQAQDTHVFAPGDGLDFIHDFETGVDQIDLSAFNIDWATVSSHMSDQNWAVALDLAAMGGAGGDKTYLIGVDFANLSANDFI
ncbi:MAG: family 16 glycosylhydrolase, partial [Planktomarina sp.]